MTKEEAIKYLQQIYPNGGHCWLDEQRIEAIGMAVKALQEEPAPKIFEDMLNAKTPAESLGISAEEHEKIIDLCLYGKEPEMVDIDDLPKEEPVSDDFTKALAECIHKAQCSVIDPLAHAEVWKEELVKLAKCEEPVSEDLLSKVDKQARCIWDEINTGHEYSIIDSYNQFYGICMQIAESIKEEPLSEELEEASKEWLAPQLDKSYANYGEAKMMELTHFDGYAMLDAIEFGAKWQKENIWKSR